MQSIILYGYGLVSLITLALFLLGTLGSYATVCAWVVGALLIPINAILGVFILTQVLQLKGYDANSSRTSCGIIIVLMVITPLVTFLVQSMLKVHENNNLGTAFYLSGSLSMIPWIFRLTNILPDGSGSGTELVKNMFFGATGLFLVIIMVSVLTSAFVE